jgi:multidrug transporter EmrE-like cation transporter
MAFEGLPPEALPHAVQTRPGGTITLVSFAVLLVSIVFAVSGQLTLKSAMDRVGRIGSKQVAAPTQTILKVAREPRLWIGLTLFGISAAFWLVALSRVPLSVAYPIVGVSYIIIVLFSRLLLHEHVPPMRWIGVIVVAIGIAIVGWSFQRVS